MSDDEVRTVRAAALAAAVARYCEAVVVPLPRLRELRVGRGHVCARYDLGGEDEEGYTVLGGRRLRYRVGDRKVGGVRRRVLGLGAPGLGAAGHRRSTVEERLDRPVVGAAQDLSQVVRPPHVGPQADMIMGQNMYFVEVGTPRFDS